MDKYSERPQIARVKEVKGDKIKIDWFDGSWSGKWRLYRYKVGKKTVVWEEEIEQTCIVQRNITLTKDNRLDSHTKKQLKTAYT